MRSREPDPSTVPICPQCRVVILPTSLGVAEHQVAHREHAIQVFRAKGHTIRPAEWPELVGLYRTLCAEYRQFIKTEVGRLRAKIVDLELDNESCRWDLKITSELVDDLKADLAAVEEGRH